MDVLLALLLSEKRLSARDKVEQETPTGCKICETLLIRRHRVLSDQKGKVLNHTHEQGSEHSASTQYYTTQAEKTNRRFG
jgi:hypothetical protein